MEQQRKPLVRNRLSIIGMILAATGLAAAFLLGILVPADTSPHVAAVAWTVAPAVFYLGAGLVVAGLFREKRRRHRADPEREPPFFRLDFDQPAARRAAGLALGAGLVLLIATSVGAYQAYQWSESTAFCAASCHPMEPERVTHRISPHAEVECAACHVGRTPAQYVEAKLYGLKEAYLLATGRYARPIAVPIQVMQPLRENCTGCHWENNFPGKKHRDYSHFIAAEGNRLWTVKLNVKVGGMYRTVTDGEGIHWHMKISPRVSYVATDSALQKIPWVRVVHADGSEVVYRSAGEPVSDSELARYPVREMTCIDCHSRPAHQFKAPLLAIDDAMARGWIDPALPDVKFKGVELLAASGYTSRDQGGARVRQEFLDYYRREYPETAASRARALEQAADTLEQLYRQNFFPEMRADWRAYPDNIGHFISDGCFRCHDGEHVSSDGRVISADCALCHDIVEQGPPGAVESNTGGLEFRHPVDLGVPARDLGKCTQCHDGTLG